MQTAEHRKNTDHIVLSVFLRCSAEFCHKNLSASAQRQFYTDVSVCAALYDLSCFVDDALIVFVGQN